MLRLALFIAVTLTGLYGFMSVFGAGNPRAHLDAAAPRPAAQDAGTTAAAAPEPRPAATATEQAVPDQTRSDQPAEAVVKASAQTPEQVQRFPGPPLRPSPEHADGTTPASAPPPGASGPILYVTGSRVNFRVGPSTGERVIGALSAGAAVEALGPTSGAWVNIRDGQGRVGYISGQFLSAEAPG